MQPPLYPPGHPHGRDEVGESSRDANSLPNPEPRTQGGGTPANAANGITERYTGHQQPVPDGRDEAGEQLEGHDLAHGWRAPHRQSRPPRYRLPTPPRARSNDPPETFCSRFLNCACIGCQIFLVLVAVGMTGFAIWLVSRGGSRDNS